MIGQFSPTFQEFKTFRETRKEQESRKTAFVKRSTLQQQRVKFLISAANNKTLSLKPMPTIKQGYKLQESNPIF
ncbi:hypothetical protein FF021_15490 [Leptospira noguchii]|nr:hypothetical protein LEP1GSC170_1501 [Leptospira interrogans serovar Bataviae str. HAI135]TQE69658.1 hypothetical protein FF021_15490 [Leptospira noguchii]